MKNNLIVLLDFDRTLFDTDNFLFEIKKIFKTIGINENTFISSYKKVKPYNIKKHLDLLKLNRQNKSLIQAKLNKLADNSKKYLFSDTIKFLKFLNKNNIKCILVTYGNKEFQNNKIKKSNIKIYLDDIYITSNNQNKINIYKNIITKNKNKSFIIIDDLKTNTENVTKKINHMNSIRINRNKNNTEISNFEKYYEVKNLDQAKKIISQL